MGPSEAELGAGACHHPGIRHFGGPAGLYAQQNGNDLHIEQTAEELRAQLTQDELQDVESVLEYKRQIRSTQAYLDDSVLVNLDAMSIPTEKLTFRMSAGTGAALRSCYDALTDRAFYRSWRAASAGRRSLPTWAS